MFYLKAESLDELKVKVIRRLRRYYQSECEE